MGLRGPRSRFDKVTCPNKRCCHYGRSGEGNLKGNGRYRTQSGLVRKFICHSCGGVFCERSGTAFYDLRSSEEQVRLALDTDLPWVMHLSGGLDSNLLLALARQAAPDREVICVSSVIENADPEWPFIKESAEGQRARLRLVTIDDKTFFNALDAIIFYLDEPVGDPGVVAQFLVNRLAADHSKVVFSGQGADEMFFGYVRDLAAYVLASTSALGTPEARSGAFHENARAFLRGWERFFESMKASGEDSIKLAYFKKLCRFDPFEQSDIISPEFLDSARDVALETYMDLLEQTSSLHDFMLAAETRIQLPALLHMEDRASMCHSVETRVPLCTASILDIAGAGQLAWKFRNGCPKGVLRDVFQDLIPAHVLRRKEKVGRPIPLRAWLGRDLGREHVESLKGKRELFSELTGMDFVGYALTRANPYDRSAWAALSLAKWIDLFHVTV